MKIILDLNSIGAPTCRKISLLLKQDLAVTQDLEQFKVKHRELLKDVSLRQLRREARDMKRAIRGLDRRLKGGAS